MNRVQVYSGLCKGKSSRDKELFFVRNQEEYDALAEKVAFTVAEQEDVYFKSMREIRDAERQERIRKMDHDEAMARIALERENKRINAEMELERYIHTEAMVVLRDTSIPHAERFRLLSEIWSSRPAKNTLKRTLSN